MEMLLRGGADPNLVNKKGLTPLHVKVKHDYVAITNKENSNVYDSVDEQTSFEIIDENKSDNSADAGSVCARHFGSSRPRVLFHGGRDTGIKDAFEKIHSFQVLYSLHDPIRDQSVIILHERIKTCLQIGSLIVDPYLKERDRLIEAEQKLQFGHDIVLQGAEIKANECLMRAKTAEIDHAFQHPEDFLPAQNFLRARKEIEQSTVFRILRRMPKGGLFHAHGLAILSIDKLLRYTHLPNLWICRSGFAFLFSRSRPPPLLSHSCDDWVPIEERRRAEPNLDQEIKRHLMLSASRNDDINHVWKDFSKLFPAVGGLAIYKPVYEKFMYEAMQELHDDNVMFMELRNSLFPLYDLDGTQHTPEETARTLMKVVKRFCANNPSFLGIKLIISQSRSVPLDAVKQKIEQFKRWKAEFPELIIGFDLVGQEDMHHSLLDYRGGARGIKDETNFFFHAGETNWYGRQPDHNLYDAIVLNTKRIGHGFALIKHPKLMEIVKEKKIVVEVSPISNQVLKLVGDMRNHPARLTSSRRICRCCPEVHEFLLHKEIECLLWDSVNCKHEKFGYVPGNVFIELTADADYTDEPDVDENGTTLTRRTTPIHAAVKNCEKPDRAWTRLFPPLFEIYDRFDVNFTDESGYTHFHAACQFSCDKAVREFLEHGQDPNCIWSETGDSVLHVAVENALDSGIMEMLLRGSADPNLVNKKGLTPLHIIAKVDFDCEIVELFFQINDELNQPVQINARDKLGNTPLHLALEYSYKKKMFEVLLRKGADPTLANNEGSTPLHVICKSGYFDDFAEIFFKVNGELNQRVQVDARDNLDRTPLQWAVAGCLPNAVESLLNRGAELSSFVFPTSSQFNVCFKSDRYKNIRYKLRLASGLLAVIENLEKRGYELDRSDALIIMKLFKESKLFEAMEDLDESWYDDEKFANDARKKMAKPNLSLYDLIHLRPQEAAKRLTYMDYYELANQEKLCDGRNYRKRRDSSRSRGSRNGVHHRSRLCSSSSSSSPSERRGRSGRLRERRSSRGNSKHKHRRSERSRSRRSSSHRYRHERSRSRRSNKLRRLRSSSRRTISTQGAQEASVQPGSAQTAAGNLDEIARNILGDDPSKTRPQRNIIKEAV
ncbi:unnamed protein product [Trichogramma brassicae]|uniref:Adenosine deaminase n=1 Tax=Trichogramma brassicae TaxID=86971 RepID=A0A6H5IS66_9HYME|nr:unnamed protein product [Trichogramma brassicae]